MTKPPLRIANCSGFYGDRLSAAREQVQGGPIDVLTGDWLAELTMLILAKGKMKRPEAGWAHTFLVQMEEVLGDCLDRGIKIVSNAGGLNPAGCAAAMSDLAERLGLHPKIAFVEGDDLMNRLEQLRESGVALDHLDTGEPLAARGIQPVTANAYLGGWGIAEALARGADIVVTGRVTDAALVVGPAAFHFGWQRDDWDRLAGACVAGHVIECGAQATGGNYSFFREVPRIERCGFPIAEMYEDGSCVITKHQETGGRVSVGTVTAQLLYEIDGPRYPNPDVIARFDTIQVDQEADDRVRVSGARGESPPDTLKVGINYLGGFRNSMTFVLTGLDIDAKAALAERVLWSSFPDGRDGFEEVVAELVRTDRADPRSETEAVASLRVTVKDPDEKKVGRAFSDRVIQTALASYPGFFTTSPPTGATPYGVFWPTTVPAQMVRQTVVIDGERIDVEPLPAAQRVSIVAVEDVPFSPSPAGDTRRAPLGTIAGARSGDKGGNANVGVWVRDEASFVWLDGFLTVDRFRELVPEAATLAVRRHRLPNLLALNFVVVGLLGEGVAASTRMDPQAKALGEYLRARMVDVPTILLHENERLSEMIAGG